MKSFATWLVLSLLVVSSRASLITLPSTDMDVLVRPGTVSFFSMTLSSVPTGSSVGNKSYSGWCVDRLNEFDPSATGGGAHTAYLLEVPGDGLPGRYANMAWDKIVYLLNHKRGTVDDVQHAIWFYTDGLTPDTALAPLAPELIADAEANGSGFVPRAGQLACAFVVWTGASADIQGNVIEVPLAPDVGSGNCSDQFTAGGFIYRNGSKVSFGLQGGVKNGTLSGGINLIDHGKKMQVRGRTVTSYRAIDANCREAIYDCTINGEPGTATVIACDYGEPGRNDVIEITLSTGYSAGQGTTLGGDRNGGGNVQLHKGSCDEPPKAKPNRGGKPPKKPGLGNGSGNSNHDDAGRGNGNGHGQGGQGKAKGKR